MTPEMKTKWVEALRSGKYKQTTGLLKDAEGYCCLGVLASINGHEPDEEGLIPGMWVDPEGLLPMPIADQIGIGHGWMSYYSGMNDSNYSFEKIAADIESIRPERLSQAIMI